ncbi:Mhp1 protein [Saccharomycopsis crataegensis]|uniref:Mhp1 protein n=1 Tax=Saccharomycopsis crataegensis TaxID=43959 RepID=A0AAV5QUE2_9ASCO|nr:Mhp1 protein [Saccharomycopsis crataegensis]
MPPPATAVDKDTGKDKKSDVIRQKLQNDASNAIQGFNKADFDWFLRGNIKRIDVISKIPSSLKTPSNNASTTNNAATASPAAAAAVTSRNIGSALTPQKSIPTVGSTNATNVQGVLSDISTTGDGTAPLKRSATISASHQHSESSIIRRTRSHTNSSNSSSGSGFFGKLSSKFSRKKSTPEKASNVPTTNTKRNSTSKSNGVSLASASSLSTTKPSSSSATTTTNPTDSKPTDQPVDENALDPRFQKFLEFYKSKGIEKMSNLERNFPDNNNNNSEPAPSTVIPEPTTPRSNGLSRLLSRTKTSDTPSSTATTASSFSFPSNEIPPSPKVDLLGRPIPPHPQEAPLPPAIKRVNQSTHGRHNSGSISDVSSSIHSTSSPKTTARFGSFLRRHQSVDQHPTSPPLNNSVLSSSSSSVSSSSSSLVEAHSVGSSQEIPGFMHMPLLKRVTFSERVFFNDPPQQIASRNPRKGEVEILKNGSILVHKLTPEERQKIMREGGGGVVVGGFGHLRIISPEEKAEEEQFERRSGSPPPPPPPVEHENDQEGAAVEKKEQEEEKEAEEDDDPSLRKAKSISIDKPMVSRHKPSGIKPTDEDGEEVSNDSSESINKIMEKKVPLDVLYARCCHLREILPIKSTLKQIPKNSTATLDSLTFKNPLPSLIEIITFGDFISIAPIATLIVDGISLSLEMLRVLLSSIAYKNDLKKLSLRNTVLDTRGWKLLCWFLVKNKSLISLDITMCSSLKTSSSSKSSKPKSIAITSIVRMDGSQSDRSEMDWSLFVASLIYRGGIESLILTGCKIKSLPIFKKLFEMALGGRTKKLGLAYNNLSYEQMEVVCNWLLKYSSSIISLDLGYNNMNRMSTKIQRSSCGSNNLMTVKGGSVNLLISVFSRIHKERKQCGLQYLSLNCTEIHEESTTSNTEGEFVEASSLIYNLSKLSNLRFLDLSGNPRYFSYNIEIFCSFLTLFSKLTRLHLDYNGIGDLSMIAICDSLMSCKHMYYLSLLGNPLTLGGYSAICNLVKRSKIISLEMDFDYIPTHLRRNIGVYTVRNMEQIIRHGKIGVNGGEDENENKGIDKDEYSLGSLTEEVVEFLQKYDEKNERGEMINSEEKKKVKQLVFEFLGKIFQIKNSLNQTIEKLIEMRLQHELNNDGKETLIRFCFIDNALDKVLRILRERYKEFADEYEITHKVTEKGASEESMVVKTQIFGKSLDHNAIDEEEDEEAYPISGMKSKEGVSSVFPYSQVRRSSSQTSLKKLDQEEGSVLKAGNLLQAKLQEHGSGDNADKGQGPQYDDHFLKHVVGGGGGGEGGGAVDGEKIKDALLDTSKLSNIVNVLDSLRENGISVEDMFKKRDVQSALEQEFANGKSLHSAKEEGSEDKDEDESDLSDTASEASIDDVEVEKETKPYDTIVDDLVRVRSRQA